MKSVAQAFRTPVAILAAVLLSLPLPAQTNTGRISGSVHDQTDAVVVGATVTITDTQRGVTRTLNTDQAGNYVAPNLNPGIYSLRVAAAGFKNIDRQNVQLETAQDVRLDFTLQPGSTTETVTVTSDVPLVNTTSAVLGGTLSNQSINEMPLNGRNFQKLLELRPGVYIFPGGGKWSQSTNGMRPDHNVYILNGIDTIEGFSSMSVMNGTGITGDASTILPIDAIQEFNSQQNPKAEYGWKPGGIVNVGLKSGTNSLHGSAYAYGRDSALDATNPFIPPGQPKQQTSLEQFGGTAGGPIVRDKLFFLAGYEGQRSLIGSPSTQKVPTTASLGGTAGLNGSLLDACRSLALAKRNALSLKMAGMDTNCNIVDPASNLFQSTGSTQFLTNFVSDVKLDNWLGKMDYHINGNNTLSGEYFLGNYGGLSPQNPIQDYWRTNVHTRAQVAGVHWTWVPNSRIVNEARFGFNRTYQPSIPGDCQQVGQPDLSYVHTGAQSCGFPLIQISGFSNLGCCINFPKVQGPDTTLQGVDGLSYVRGNHAFKFGGELRRLIYNGGTWRGGRGLITFNASTGAGAQTALQNFLAGVPQSANVLMGSPQRHVSDWGMAGYAQDDWRLTNNFTLNLGLRYEYVTVMKEANNLLANFDPAQGLVQVGKQISEPFHADPNNFSPRVGFAWDMKGDSKWVLRGGGSIIYVLEGFNVLISQQGTKAITTGLNTTPTGAMLNGVAGPGNITTGSLALTASQVAWNLTGPIFPAGQIACTTAAPCPILAVDPNLRSPYVTAWSLSLQHAFTNDLSLEVAYVGNHGTKLTGMVDMNAPAAGAGWTAGLSSTAGQRTAAENKARPFASLYPYLSNINQVRNVDESNYDGLQTTLTQRPWHGLSYTVGYTWSHALDQTSADWNANVPMNSSNPAADYGSGAFDVRQRMTVSLSYALPEKKGHAQLLEGWRINSIVNVQTSPPWNIADSSSDVSGTGEFTDRWNFYGNPGDFSGLRSTVVPFYAGQSNAGCLAQATAQGTGALNSLQKFGCYAIGNSMMLPPALGTFGTMGRNIFRGNGLKLFDLSLTKTIKFSERFSGQFRAEGFNVINHTQYALPAGPNVTQSNNNPGAGINAALGSSTSTPDVAISNPQIGSGAARSVQLAFKVIF